MVIPVSISVLAQENTKKEVYFKDSTSAVNFLNTLSLCGKIDYAENNIGDIIKSKGFSVLILQSISKDAKTQLLIQSINGTMVVPDDRVILDLIDQFNKIKITQECK